MDRAQFTALRDLPGKRIDKDLVYEVDPAHAPLKKLKTVDVVNAGGVKVKLDGTFHPLRDAVSFTFSCAAAGGPICRVDVRGTVHKQAGRTHKHDLHQPSDPTNNLPAAQARPDLEALSAREVWRDLCARASIEHHGDFLDPAEAVVPTPE